MNVTGRILAISQIEQRESAGKLYKSQYVVLDITPADAQYNETIVIECGDKVLEALNSHKANETVTISYNCRAAQSKTNGRWFNCLRAWRIASAQQPQMVVQPQPTMMAPQQYINQEPQQTYQPQQGYRQQPAPQLLADSQLPF